MMKGNMMILAPLCLLLCWTLLVDSMAIRLSFTLQEESLDFPLNMAEKSVDDMYLGCNERMMGIIEKRYLNNEKRQFLEAWNKARKCAEEKVKQSEDKDLTIDHMEAICLYTGDKVYKQFNEAVRGKRDIYTSDKFQFHSLHFRLTSAVQTLNRENHCQTVYRRTNITLTGKAKKIIRFGSFASSSLWSNLTHFGRKTCIKIKTCLGASLKNYSHYGNREAEVLIPPYEMFKITQKIERRVKIPGLEDCKVVYVLESVGVMSNLNCQIAHLSEFTSSPLARGKVSSDIFKPFNSPVDPYVTR